MLVDLGPWMLAATVGTYAVGGAVFVYVRLTRAVRERSGENLPSSKNIGATRLKRDPRIGTADDPLYGGPSPFSDEDSSETSPDSGKNP